MSVLLFVEPNAPQAILWSRQADRAWAHTSFDGIDASIEVKSLNLVLKLAELYSGLEFRSAPRLVRPGNV